MLFADAGSATWAAIAFAAALLHVANHAIFKALLFLGAGAFERAVGSLDLDHLGGLLRRMPWTGGAFLVGAMAIAGLPPLNGFASEWLTLQSLLHVGVCAARSGSRSPARLRSRRWPATAALALLCFVKVRRARAARPAAPRRSRAGERGTRVGMRGGMASWPRCASRSAAPGAGACRRSRAWRPGAGAALHARTPV